MRIGSAIALSMALICMSNQSELLAQPAHNLSGQWTLEQSTVFCVGPERRMEELKNAEAYIRAYLTVMTIITQDEKWVIEYKLPDNSVVQIMEDNRYGTTITFRDTEQNIGTDDELFQVRIKPWMRIISVTTVINECTVV